MKYKVFVKEITIRELTIEAENLDEVIDVIYSDEYLNHEKIIRHGHNGFIKEITEIEKMEGCDAK